MLAFVGISWYNLFVGQQKLHLRFERVGVFPLFSFEGEGTG